MPVQRHRLWVQRHRSATLKLEATSHSAKHLSQHKKKTDLWAQKGTVKAVILFPRFDAAHIHQQCRDTECPRFET